MVAPSLMIYKFSFSFVIFIYLPEITYICRSYEAEISFLDIPHSEVDPHALMPQGPWTRTSSFGKRKSSHEDNKKVWAQWKYSVCDYCFGTDNRCSI